MLSSGVNQGGISGIPRRGREPSEKERQSEQLMAVLQELRGLLESYAPLWYTREHQERAESSLRCGRQASDAFIELYDLLEEYAPLWYTKEHHERAAAISQLLRKP